MSQPFPFRKVYGPAIVIAGITLGGLLSALFGDGVWDELSWVALAVPLAVFAWSYSFGRKVSNRTRGVR
jgi:hypothetical protein